jgi:anti-sigma factor RsiW
MRCETARRILWPQPGPRPATDEAAAAFEHYSSCEECRRFFAHQNVLGRRLKHLGARVKAPPGLVQRISAALADETVLHATGSRSRRLSRGALALVAAAALLVVVIRPTGVPAEVAQPLVTEAQVILSQPEGYSSSDIRELENWLELRVGYPVHIPDISNSYLVGVRIATLAGTKTAAAVYLVEGMPLTYFALPSGRVLGLEVRGSRVKGVSSDGYNVALWAERGRARAIVAPMPLERVVGVAEECRNKSALRAS